MSDKEVVPCQHCGGLEDLSDTCEHCGGVGAFVVDRDRGEDPNRYGPGGELGPRAPAPGLWVSGASPPPRTGSG